MGIGDSLRNRLQLIRDRARASVSTATERAKERAERARIAEEARKAKQRRSAIIGGALFGGILAVCLIAGGVVALNPAEPKRPQEATRTSSPTADPLTAKSDKPTVAPAPTLSPWAGPTDGTWQYGDIAFGQTFHSTYGEWRVGVQGLPQFGPLQANGVTVTSRFLVDHVADAGNKETVYQGNSFFFITGDSSHPLDESYGTQTVVKCDREIPPVGESAACDVSFTAPTSEMQNFYWLVDAQSFAAWPSQVP